MTLKTPLRHTLALSLAASAVLLTACGGGGGELVVETPTVTAPIVGASNTGTSGTTVTTGGATTGATTSGGSTSGSGTSSASSTDGSCGLANFQAEMMRLVNEARTAGQNCRSRGAFAATAVLAWNSRLATAALGHSTDMAANNYFDHTSRDGRTFVQRIEAAGYDWARLGENIAAGHDTIAEVVAGWLASDSHCANLMDPNLREVGVACMPGASGARYSHYWTMDLGTAR